MIRILTYLALAAGAWLAMPAPVQAAESYDNCTGYVSSLPASITTQGTWCLNKDLATSMASGNAITIATNNVTLDCNHFKIGGLGAGAGTTAFGIYAQARLNTSVRNCNIRGFYIGLFFSEGAGHLIEHSSLDSNTVYGIYLSSPGSTIRRNHIIDTGGSSASTGAAFGVYVESGVDILDNAINGVAPTGTNANAYGIYTWDNGYGGVSGNRVRGLAATGTGAPLGIYNVSSGRGVIRDNDVQGPGTGVAGGLGIRCTDNGATAKDNVVAGFSTGIDSCLTSANVVNGN
jgi:hypothetical protein